MLRTLRLLTGVLTFTSVVAAQSTPTVTQSLPAATIDTAASVITAPPEINDVVENAANGTNWYSDVIGVFPWPDERDGPSWGTRSCSSSSYFATGFNGRYGMCCDATAAFCMSVTSCGSGGTAYGPGTFYGGCATGYECETVTVFESKGSPTSYYYLGCSAPGDTSWVSKVYRHGFTFSTTSSRRTTQATTTVLATTTVSRNHGSKAVPLPAGYEILLGFLERVVGLL
ncbi:hypothetical protein JX265_006625 [Neoarthrinium moseri]|uniref:Uncharacterized protein n=1 Tax=Neoarthrinium moseri TaxID=1658444 RepID=A0A9P9WLQ8_9PEZI|nr:uncharacterized protein JN550_003005 [Neoarthrinium moseri]KAI1855233.1 hypothetical protein JX266_000098 [Neoarthrinium moseri]KAI1869535.1 hypothetical protein JX265_006625 [Neoarthrinium moseri]KAI1873736.1 hypothetical protein JN550_003005 [Neoarthrinium moseri]